MQRNLIFLLLPLLFLAGCSGTAGQTETAEIELTYMAPGYGQSYIGSESVEKINASGAGIRIRPVIYSEDQYYTVLKTKLATGQGPDIFSVQPGYGGPVGVSELAKAGYLAPVESQELLDKAKAADCTVLEYDGEPYSFSIGRMALGVCYNLEMFADHGLSVPSDWEGFLDCCETLSAAGITPLTLGAKERSNLQYGLYQLAAGFLYPEYPDYDEELRAGERKFTDPGTWDRILEMYAELYTNQYMDEDSLNLSAEQAMQRMESGDAAMIFCTSMEAEILIGQEEGSFGFFSLPGAGEGESCWCIGEIGGIGMYAETEYPEECREVLETVFWTDIIEAAAEESQELFGEAYRSGNYYPPCNQEWYYEVEVVMENKLAEYLSGGDLSIQDITQAMQEELER